MHNDEISTVLPRDFLAVGAVERPPLRDATPKHTAHTVPISGWRLQGSPKIALADSPGLAQKHRHDLGLPKGIRDLACVGSCFYDSSGGRLRSDRQWRC